MPLELYVTPGSPPCCVVLMTAAALDLQIKTIPLDVEKDEQKKPEYLKLNPAHTVPTLVDNGFVLPESRAISKYLVDKYGVASSLYPKDPQARAIVDHRLDFDLGTLYARLMEYFYPQFMLNTPADPALLKKLEEALEILNTFLGYGKYAAGSELTLADFSLVASVSTIEVVEIDINRYPNIVKWYNLVKSTAPKCQEVNQKSLDAMKAYFAEFKAKTQ